MIIMMEARHVIGSSVAFPAGGGKYISAALRRMMAVVGFAQARAAGRSLLDVGGILLRLMRLGRAAIV